MLSAVTNVACVHLIPIAKIRGIGGLIKITPPLLSIMAMLKLSQSLKDISKSYLRPKVLQFLHFFFTNVRAIAHHRCSSKHRQYDTRTHTLQEYPNNNNDENRADKNGPTNNKPIQNGNNNGNNNNGKSNNNSNNSNNNNNNNDDGDNNDNDNDNDDDELGLDSDDDNNQNTHQNVPNANHIWHF